MWKEFGTIIKLLFGPEDELREIIFVTLKMSLYSTIIGSILGLIVGYFISVKRFKGKAILRRVINTLMGLPPVVAGLVVFLILSRSGPLGELKLLYSLNAMVIAQIFLITPIVTGLSIPTLSEKNKKISETAKGIGLSKFQQFYLLFFESRKQIIGVILSAFGRSISEVGAVQLVGGNIQYKTRVMTTAIMLETNRGNFYYAVALGIVLLLISLAVNSIVAMIQDNKRETL